MRKLFLTLLFCLLPLSSFADHYVYIRTYNKTTVDPDQIAVGTYGRSKKGDIVDIRVVTPSSFPSATAQSEWAIVRVTGITDADIEQFKEKWQQLIGTNDDGHPIYKKIMNRRRKLDIDTLGIGVGLYPATIAVATVKPHIHLKTAVDIVRARRQYRLYALRRPFIYAYNRIIKSAQAEVTSTINLPGEDYDTLTLWEDAKDGDLVTDTRQETASCYDDDGDLVDALIINDSTTNATYYMKVSSIAAERHNGTDTGFTIKHAGNTEAILISDAYTIIEWLVIDGSTVNARNGIHSSEDPATGVVIRNNIVHSINDGTYHGIFAARVGVKIVNNIVYGCAGTGFDMGEDTENSTAYNCTAYNNTGDGFENGGANSTSTLINCISIGNGADYDANGGAWNGSCDKNIDGDGTAPGGTTYTSTATEEWVNPTGSPANLHLLGGATCDAENSGDDLGTTDGVNFDIDNRDRDALGDTWDIGADEHVPSIGQPVIIFM